MQKVHILSGDRNCVEKTAFLVEPAFTLKVLEEPGELAKINGDSVCIIVDEAVSGEHTGKLLDDIFVKNGNVPVLVVLTDSDLAKAVRYSQMGVLDCIAKPIDTAHLSRLLTRAFLNTSIDSDPEDTILAKKSGIIGSDQKTRTLREKVARIAARNSAVLIYGETGSGKEVVARAIHRLSPRANEPFLAVNCASIPSGLFESEFFGVTRGAYTGATQRQGVFADAHKGTVFLDEIGELPLENQAKLLRVIEEKKVRPLGTTRTIRIDVRVISATNRNITEMIQRGRFRRDLYYRVSTAPLQVHPLRDRPGDFWDLVAVYYKDQGRAVPVFSPDARDVLESHRWPGNVRELFNVLERSETLSRGKRVLGRDIMLDEF